ncbi:MAG TPA: TraR/DksA family transcriptional regulator [Bryobacteraceae bacterium]|nr:TraR/DksA family transcriptional regulator [Bryobacteraceae bacterium]
MTSMEAQRFTGILQALRAELAESLASREEIHIERAPDMMDDLQHSSSRDLAVAEIERKNRKIGQIDDALARIAAGSYGICEDCEELIPQKRLNAVPWTQFCVQCQERHDARSEGYGMRQEMTNSAELYENAA